MAVEKKFMIKSLRKNVPDPGSNQADTRPTELAGPVECRKTHRIQLYAVALRVTGRHAQRCGLPYSRIRVLIDLQTTART